MQQMARKKVLCYATIKVLDKSIRYKVIHLV